MISYFRSHCSLVFGYPVLFASWSSVEKPSLMKEILVIGPSAYFLRWMEHFDNYVS